jgi:hypothetical protein
MLIMGMDDEVKKATEWVTKELSFDVSTSVSVFEVTIRFVGTVLFSLPPPPHSFPPQQPGASVSVFEATHLVRWHSASLFVDRKLCSRLL